LGTAHGERKYSYVAHTHFTRAHDQPEEIVRIRYDSLEHLVALGIIPSHRLSDGGPDPFPDAGSHSYVPDPPPWDGR
jgi:hypothetical protein